MGKYQPFNDLDSETDEALRKSIARFGVVCPVIIDGNGSIIDGHQRARIAGELGLTYPTIKRSVKNADDAMALAFSLNTDRRMLSLEDRRRIVADLREQGYSLRAIANVTKTSVGTAYADAKASGVQPEHVVGEDGRLYPPARHVPPVEVDANGEIVDGRSANFAERSETSGEGIGAVPQGEPDHGVSTGPGPSPVQPTATPDERYRLALRGLMHSALRLASEFPDHEHNVRVQGADLDIFISELHGIESWVGAALDLVASSSRLKAVK